jgi:hypothetical protein
MPPLAPTISTTLIQPWDGIRVNISNPDTVDQNDVYRHDGDGVWEFLGTSLGSSGTFTDFAAASGVTYTYRATAVASDESTTNSNTVNASVTLTDWYIKDLSDINASIEVLVDGSSSLDIEDTEDMATFNPIGRRYPIVIKEEVVKASKFDITAQFLGQVDYLKFKELRQRQKTLLLQSPMTAEQWYFAFGSPIRQRVMNVQSDYRLVTFPVIEVGRPSVPDQ